MENKKIKYLIALAGLFHDIGKLVYRTKDFPSEKGDQIFGRYHAYLSKEWIEKHSNIFDQVDNSLKQKLIDWGARHHNPNEELESRLMQIADWYSSAHDRERILKDKLNILHSVFERITLKDKIRLKDKKDKHDIGEIKNFGLYLPSKLALEKDVIFPQVVEGYITEDFLIGYTGKTNITVSTNGGQEEFALSDEKKKTELNSSLAGLYKKLYEDFEKEFTKLAPNFTNSIEKFTNFVFYILHKYLWSVPAATYDSKHGSNHYPDISLFDHSRVLSAIATSLYDYSVEKGIKKPKKNSTETFDNEEAFLLIEGDIGGIQKFLFNIYKSSEAAEEGFSIAKALRGRSFFLSMLPEIIARYILNRLGYPITNMLFVGAGKFQLLVGNTKENREKLKAIEEKIIDFLFKEFQLELNFVLAYRSFEGKEFKLSNGFLNQIEYLHLELDKKKKQRLGKFIFEELEGLDNITQDLCPSCKTLPVEKDKKKRFCKWCNLSQNIGGKIPKIKYIAFTEKDIDLPADIDLGEFGKAILLDEDDLKEKDLSNINEILVLNDTALSKKVNGFKFLGNTVPIIIKHNVDILKELADEETEKFIKEGNVLPFELLVKFAEGDKKLGFLRADVDNLGLILSDGLRTPEFERDKGKDKNGSKNNKDDESIYTISRIATLSRMLDMFFSGYLNKLAEEETKEYLNELINKKDTLDVELKNLVEKIENNRSENRFINSLIYIVYSGGDDLFIIAPYNLALQFAQRIREKFAKFTAENNEFGLSGGLLFARHNLPINLVAKYSKKLEDKAKTRTKDKLAIFQKAYKWNEDFGESSLKECNKENQQVEVFYLSEIERTVSNFVNAYKKDSISRRFIYNLLVLYKMYTKTDEDGNIQIDKFIYPKLHYQIARNIKDKDKENPDVRKKIIQPLLDIKQEWVIKNLDTIVSLVLMKTRKGG